MKEFYSEVKCNYNNSEGFWCVDAWRTDDGNEEGKVVAAINDTTGDVFYCEPEARLSPMVAEVVKRVALPIKERFNRKKQKGKPYVIDVIWGEAASDKASETSLQTAKRWIAKNGEGASGIYRFETKTDRDTAIRMLEDSDGWMGNYWEKRDTKR